MTPDPERSRASAAVPPPGNEDIATVLERIARLLELQDANPHRVRAYRRAAAEIMNRSEPIAVLLDPNGDATLEDLPGIGPSIAGTIREYVHTGRVRMLERLEGEVSPEDLFCTLPGIGEELAHRIHAALHVETLEDLEVAAHDGRLASVQGIGERRRQGIQAALETALSQSTRRRARQQRLALAKQHALEAGEMVRPSVKVLLDIDSEYRRRAAAGELRRIAPRRLNPTGQAWLPILHTEREGWSWTALFSNTARAHELGKTGDWVVLFFEQDGHEDQCTIVTETHGALKGQRVVRGREEECAKYYASRSGEARR